MSDPLPDRLAVRRFQDLMRFRVRHILLVSSLYDSFILVEDGQLNEAILRESVELNLTENPDLTRVSTGVEALALARQRPFDLIIATPDIGELQPVELTAALRDEGLDTPVILLGYEHREIGEYLSGSNSELLENVFLWQGDVRILLAMISSVEDRRNVVADCGEHGVPLILVVEDNVRFYSSFLPVIYAAIVNHTHGLIAEALNLPQKILRTRARPKVLLARTYEEAEELLQAYPEQTLGLISDIEFPRDGKLDKSAGVDLARFARRIRQDLPIVLQSSIPDNQSLADDLDCLFLLKGSPVLLAQLKKILLGHFGFGVFEFRLPDGSFVDRAQDLQSLVEKLRTVPDESLVFHGERNHFSNWLKARTEFTVAEALRAQRVTEFASTRELRERLIQAVSDYRMERDRVVIADFDPLQFDGRSSITRIGGGSLGGKARGLAFINRLLYESRVSERFPDQQIFVPECVTLGTDVFEQFLDTNDLRSFALESGSNQETHERFMAMPFPESVIRDLRVFLERCTWPLAVRSSGLLEDSANQPFAGVYQTFMLPNNHPNLEQRLVQLVAAIKQVYASTFFKQAKDFLRMTAFRLEEERMAVIIQRIVGEAHGSRFYPEVSGVARSHNFYPSGPLKSRDGIAAVALGMGRTVVEGGQCLRFSPRHPQHLAELGTVEDMLNRTQREFFALDLESPPAVLGNEGEELSGFTLSDAEQDGTLHSVGSTYSPDNDRINDGLSRPGVRLVTFAPILKHDRFPLAEILRHLLEVGEAGMGGAVEIEFAVNLSVPPGERPEFGFLQLRPLPLTSDTVELEIGEVDPSEVVCRSSSVLGNGRIEDVLDIVFVDPDRFDRLKSQAIAHILAEMNDRLMTEGSPYVLLGSGRWGSSDPYLGIPVHWGQIAGARVIVESEFRDMIVEPSQGSHFFQNLTSSNVGYFTVSGHRRKGYIDWDWLRGQPAVESRGGVSHVRLSGPLDIKMDGQRGDGVILKPETRSTS